MNQPLPVVLIGGQSNAVGCTDIATLKESDSHGNYSKVLLYQEGNFTAEAKHRILHGVHLGMGCKPHQMGIEYGIAHQLNERISPIALIRFAYGGTDLAFHWKTLWERLPVSVEDPGYCYHEFIGTVKRGLAAFCEAGYTPCVKGMIWMQGESDTNKTLAQAEAYADHLSLLFGAIRKNLALAELKLLIGGISTKAPLAPYSDLIREKQALYCQNDPLARYVDNTDLSMGSDGWHYEANECFRLGKRLGEEAAAFFKLR